VKTITAILHSLIPQEHQWKITLFEQWGDLMGPMSRSVTIERIMGTCLFLGVTHPALAQELSYISLSLQNKINARLGACYINAIRFIYTGGSSQKKETKQEKIKLIDARDNREDLVELTVAQHRMLESLHDQELRKSLKLFYVRSVLIQKRGTDGDYKNNNKKINK
jgi:hypothetical protein